MSKTVSAAIIIDCILIILTLSFIFGNSLKNVEKSSNDSEKITEIVEKLPPVQTAIEKEIINKNDLEGIIRSMAHIFEFTLLGAELMLLLLLVEVDQSFPQVQQRLDPFLLLQDLKM